MEFQRNLYERLASPLANVETPSARPTERRLIAIEDVGMYVTDVPDNIGAGRGPGTTLEYAILLQMMGMSLIDWVAQSLLASCVAGCYRLGMGQSLALLGESGVWPSVPP